MILLSRARLHLSSYPEVADDEPSLPQIEILSMANNVLDLDSIVILPRGTSYAMCTTIQYGNQPCSNSTMLTVDPQSTIATISTKTAEEMQQEAKDSGGLSIYNEFSWSYPWYKVHVKIQVNPTIDIGFNPILSGGETHDWTGLETFSNVMEEVWQDIMLDFAGTFASYLIAKGLSLWNWVPGIIAEGIKGTVQYCFLWLYWGDSAKMLAMSVANVLMGLVALVASVGEAFVKALQSFMSASTWSAILLACNGLTSLALPLQVIRTPVDYIESIFVDFPIAVLAMLRYLGRI